MQRLIIFFSDKKSNETFYEIKSKLMKFFISYKDNQEKTTKAFCESTWDSIHEERDIKIKLFQNIIKYK